MEKISHIVFDHDGTLVNTTVAPRVLYPGIKQVIELLAAQQVKMYVWTARYRKSTIEILGSLAIIDAFAEVVTPDDAEQKPHPAGLEMILGGVDPAQVVVIGDSLSDMRGARSFGVRGLGALWAHKSLEASELMMKNGASSCFASVSELKEYLIKRI